MVHDDFSMKYRILFLCAHKRPKCISKNLLRYKCCSWDLHDAIFNVLHYFCMFYFMLSLFQLLFCVQANSIQCPRHCAAIILVLQHSKNFMLYRAFIIIVPSRSGIHQQQLILKTGEYVSEQNTNYMYYFLM